MTNDLSISIYFIRNIIVVCLLAFTQINYAQHSSLRCLKFFPGDSIKLKSGEFIERNSIEVRSVVNPIISLPFKYFPDRNLILIDSMAAKDSLSVCYRVFPIRLQQDYFHYDTKILQQPQAPEYASPDFNKTKNSDWWKNSGINYSGSFIRGISTGNNQSLVLNSSLNLQLSGDLGDGYAILGAISDNQIPIQPEGNTRQIQEFDRLYLQILKNRNKLTAGDFEIGNPQGYFLKYQKKNQGGMLETQSKICHGILETKSAIAVSKGKSNRVQLTLQNGNQGPYRLHGSNGEAFIILLAGTEKVWLDGRLLERGEQGDYIMNYNLAELNFTTKTVIHDQLRIIVEFEYLDQNYNRSLIVHQSNFSKNNTSVYVNLFHEQDSKRPAIEGRQDSLDQILLAAIGDDLKLAFTSGVQRAGSNFNENRNYYRQRDTTVVIKGVASSFNYYYNDPYADSSAFQVQFSELGPGKAHYRLKQSSANGRVYEWISPDPLTGEPRGSYDPVIPLIAPQRKTLLNAGLQYSGKNHSALKAEIAFSSFDANRISPLQDEDNRGIALFVDAKAPVLHLWSSLARIKISGEYEYVHKNFSPANTFRTIEFAREWNSDQLYGLTDHIPKWSVEIEAGKRFSLKLSEKRMIRSDDFMGTNRLIESNWKDSLKYVSLKYGWLITEDAFQHSKYIKPELQFNQQLGPRTKIQLFAIREENKRFYETSDSLLSHSFAFNSFESKTIYSFNRGNQFSLTGKYRSDDLVKDGKLERYSDALEGGIEAQFENSNTGQWNLRFNARNIRYQNDRLNDSLSRFFFLGSIDHQLTLFKKCLRLNNYYEVQSGVEPRLEFVFEERKPGEGDYIYIDFNGDGIRQVFEYVYAPDIDTAKFVRFQLLNSEYVQIYKSSWNQLLVLDFNKLEEPQNKFSVLLKTLSIESSFRLSSKLSSDSEFEDRINPLLPLLDVNRTIGHQIFMQHNLYFQRNHPVVELQFYQRQNGIKQLLTSGTDERKTSEPGCKFRWTYHKSLDLYLDLQLKNEQRINNAYLEQNYKTKTIAIKPAYVYRINSGLRVFGHMALSDIKEIQINNERAKLFEIEQGLAAFFFKKLSWRASLKYLHASFNGKAGSLLEYELLQGFKDGNNAIWDIHLDYKINSYLQLAFSYSGRKAATNPILHTGRMQLRANF